MGFFTLFPYLGLDFLDPVAEALGDFELTDIVFSDASFEHERKKVDEDILMVDTGDLTRDGIAQQLRILYKYHPKVIGIDHFFRKPKDYEGDSAFINALHEAKIPVVLVTKASKPNEDISKFDSLETSHPMFLKTTLGACANLSSDVGDNYGEDAFKTCRSFRPTFNVEGKTELAFAVKLAQLKNPQLANEFLKRNNQEEVINFRRRLQTGAYAALSVNQVLTEQFIEDVVKDKIVIMGTLKNFYNKYDTEDMFFTPMNKSFAGKAHLDMNGAVIHANIISMIMAKDYIDEIPGWIADTLGVILCFLNVMLFRWILFQHGTWYDAIAKVTQLVQGILIMGLLVVLMEYRIKIDLTLLLGSVAVIGDLLEIYEDVIRGMWHKRHALIERIKKYLGIKKPFESDTINDSDIETDTIA
jgi:CHASE2 domain-containing sensor protein